MDRKKELLKINKDWARITLIKLLAFAEDISVHDDFFFDDLETIVDRYVNYFGGRTEIYEKKYKWMDLKKERE